MPPDVVADSGWPAIHAATLLVPDCTTTCTGYKHVIDFCIVSSMLRPFLPISHMHMPWGPHVGLKVVLEMVPKDVAVRSVVEPLPLPMQAFNEN